MQKLRCVIVDEDAASIQKLADYCRDIPYVEVTESFHQPELFIASMPKLGNVPICT